MFTHKLVAVMNEKVEAGRQMNSLAHMCIGFGAHVGKESLRLTDYKDAGGNSHPHISEIPFIILEANSNKIRNLRKLAIEQNIAFVDFTHTMIEGTFQEQIERSRLTKEEDLTYFGIVLFGEWDKVTEMTRKFSLLK